MKKIFLLVALSCLTLASYANDKTSYADYFTETYADVGWLPYNRVMGAAIVNGHWMIDFQQNVASRLVITITISRWGGVYEYTFYISKGDGGIGNPAYISGLGTDARVLDVISICPSSDNTYQYCFFDGTPATCDPGDII